MSTPRDAGIGAFAAPTFDPTTFDTSRFGLSTDLVDEDRYQRKIGRAHV